MKDKNTKLDGESEEGRRTLGRAQQLLALLEALFDSVWWIWGQRQKFPIPSPPLPSISIVSEDGREAKTELLLGVWERRSELYQLMSESGMLEPKKRAKAAGKEEEAGAALRLEAGRESGPVVQLVTLLSLFQHLLQPDSPAPLAVLRERGAFLAWLYDTAAEKVRVAHSWLNRCGWMTSDLSSAWRRRAGSWRSGGRRFSWRGWRASCSPSGGAALDRPS